MPATFLKIMLAWWVTQKIPTKAFLFVAGFLFFIALVPKFARQPTKN
jgi:putative Ca2+/H+ antiporter (TMEM165/GDT1 family)